MVVINPVSAVLGIAQLGMGVAGAFGEQRKHEDQVAQAQFQNFISREKTRLMNDYRKRAFGRQVDFAKIQQEFNADAANRAFITEQARFNEQMAQFAFNQTNYRQDLLKQQGSLAASENYGRSSQRLAALETLGQYGRNQAILAKSLASASQQSQRNLDEIGRQWRQADYQVYGSVMEPPMMEMAEPLYKAGGGPNMALSIGGAALGATSSFFAGSKTYSKGTLVDFM